MANNCPYYKWEGGFFSGDYFCTKKNESINSTLYEKYCKKSYESGGYGDCPNYKYEEPSYGCFITTIVCDTLKMDDNNMYLTLLRKFRKEYLQKKQDGIKILEEYDTIGPIISHCISKDEKREEVAKGVFMHSIIPVINDICENKYSEAIKKYSSMTKGLIKRYGLETLTLSVPGVSIYDYNQDRSMMGHGRLIKTK